MAASLIAASAPGSRSSGGRSPGTARADLRHSQLAVLSQTTDPASDIYTYAGNGTAGDSGDGGPAPQAEFDGTWADADDANLNVAFPDYANNKIRLVAGTSGDWLGIPMIADDVYTVAGNGTVGYTGNPGKAISSEINDPYATTFDASGNLIFSDETNNVIRLVSAETCSMSCPYQLSSMTAGYIYTIAGDGYDAGTGNGGYSGDGAAATSAELNSPTGLTVDKWGNVVFSDATNYRVRLVSDETCSTACPYGLASMTPGYIYTIAGTGTAGYSGNGVAATGAEVNWVTGVSEDKSGNIVLADIYNNIIRVVAGSACSSCYGSSMSAGYIYTIAGTGTAGYSGDDSAATSAEIDWPRGVAVDSYGNVVFADTNNNVIRVVAESSATYYGIVMTSGDIYTVAGNGTAGYEGDGGPASLAELDHPIGVATDALGQIIVTDSANYVVRVLGGGPVSPQSSYPQGSALGADLYGGGGGPQAQCPCSTGSPIDLATGDYYDTVTDLTIPGAGIPLQFTRTYDAMAAQAEESAASIVPPLGYGWASNLGMSVSESMAGLATVTEANGALITFQYYGAGASGEAAWCPSDATVAVFCPTAPRYIATLSGSSGSFTYVDNLSSPMTYTFNSSNALSGIKDANGDTLDSSSYVSGCPSGDTCTEWTSSASGEALVVEVNTSSGELLSVFDPAATLQSVSFTYSGTGCSTWGGSQPADLCSATTPGSLTTTYTYDSANMTAKYDYDELTMSPPATGAVTNTYTAGQVTEQTVTTASGVTQVTKLSYTTNSLAGGTTTTVTFYPLGTGGGEPTEVSSYEYSNLVLASETTASGTTDFKTDGATLLSTTSADGAGNVTGETLDNYGAPGGTESSSADATLVSDGNDKTEQYAYTADNLVWCSVSAAAYAAAYPGAAIRCPPSAPSSPPAAGSDVGMTITVYNLANEPTSVTDPLGNTTTYSYSTSGYGVPTGLVYCSIDPVEYGHVTCPATYTATATAKTTATTYNSFGNVTSTTDPDGDETTYAYGVTGHPGLVASETSPDGTTTVFTYNTIGEVLSRVVTFPSSSGYSATTEYTYDSSGHEICETDPYEYAKGVTACPTSPPTPPTPSSDAYLGDTITGYDADGRVIQSTNPLGGITYTAYDEAGEVYCTVAPYEAAKGVTCPSASSSPPSVGTGDGATITSYDSYGRVIQVTNPLGGVTLTTYDEAGNVASTTVESGNTSAPNIVTAYTYDGDNRVLTTSVGSSPTVDTTSVSYDPNGNVFCSVSANAYAAGSSTYQCPAWQAGWILAPPSPSSLYSTSPSASQANNVTTAFFNADGEQLQSTNPDIETSISDYDADGRTTCTSDPVNVAAWLTANSGGTYPYDCPSTPLTSPPSGGSDPGYVTTIYDAAGRATSVTDQIGDTTSYTYSKAGEVLTMVDPRGNTTTDCYYYQNASGQCAHSAPATGGSADDLYSQTTPATSADPSGETTTHTYYPGELADKTTTLAGVTTDSYDGLGDLTSAAYSGTASGYASPPSVTYTYFTDGSRETTADGTGTTTYNYDSNGDLLSQALAPATDSGLASATLAYSYFVTGALASVVYPTYPSHTNPTASYTDDARGNMASVTDWLGNEVTFGTDYDGNETSQDNDVSGSYPSGTSSTAFNYDSADLNTSAVSTEVCSGTNGTLTQSFSGSSGSRNADGQLTEDEETYAGSCAGHATYERNYSYDIAGRVVYQGATAQGSSANDFSYDSSSDPTEISSHDGSGNFDTYTQTFDNAGEVTGQSPVSGSHGSSSTYIYDTLGAQVSASGSSTTYGYDALGRLTSTATAPLAGTSDAYTGDGLVASVSGWSPKTDIDGTNILESVSCPSTSFCAAVDNAGDVLTYNGTSWSTDHLDGTNILEGVSCPTTTFCAAVDNDGEVTTYNGTTWTTPASIDGTTVMSSVSCTSSSFCTAVDNGGNALIYNGTTWTKKGIDSKMLDRVSCASSSVCAAVDNSGYIVSTSNGWSTKTNTDADGSTHIGSISCPTASFCAAVDNSGNVITGNPSTPSWASAVSIDASNLIESISCRSATFCVAVDVSGNAMVLSGSTWAPAEAVDTTTLRGPSCESTTYCVAIDNKGNVLGYDGSAVAQVSWGSAVSSMPVVASDASWDYIYGPGAEPVEQVNVTASPPASNPQFMTYSSPDSAWLTTSASGNQLSFYRYDAFGTPASGTPGSAFGYAGQYAGLSANANGLENMRARWFEPQTGGFATRDAAFSQTDEAYTYTGGDPVNETDPSGQYTVALDGDECLPVGLDQSDCVTFADVLASSNCANELAEVDSNLVGECNPHTGFNAGQLYNGLNEFTNPMYGALIHGYDAYALAQDPCSGDWAIAEQADLGFVGFDGGLLIGFGAAGGLATAAEGGTSLTAGDLSGDVLSNYNRFLKSLPSGAGDVTITQLSDGSYQFSSDVPATNIPGSYATYTKVVGPDGVTSTFFKTTIAPDGSVVSVKVKYP